jgi:hypothetical protein
VLRPDADQYSVRQIHAHQLAQSSVTLCRAKAKGKTVDKDFTITDATTVVIIDGTDRKQLTGKDALKDEAVKEGAQVTVVSSPDGKVSRVRIGTPPKKDQE